MKVYIAGAISGQTLWDVINKFTRTKSLLEENGMQVLSPLEGINPRVGISERSRDSSYPPAMVNHAIVARDRWYVEQCDAMFVDLTGCEMASIRSCFEIAWGNLLGKYIIAVIPEDDIIHNHAFVLEACSVVFRDYDSAFLHLCEVNH